MGFNKEHDTVIDKQKLHEHYSNAFHSNDVECPPPIPINDCNKGTQFVTEEQVIAVMRALKRDKAGGLERHVKDLSACPMFVTSFTMVINVCIQYYRC